MSRNKIIMDVSAAKHHQSKRNQNLPQTFIIDAKSASFFFSSSSTLLPSTHVPCLRDPVQSRDNWVEMLVFYCLLLDCCDYQHDHTPTTPSFLPSTRYPSLMRTRSIVESGPWSSSSVDAPGPQSHWLPSVLSYTLTTDSPIADTICLASTDESTIGES